LPEILSYPCLPRVKICGITSVDDGLLAVNAGADAIGLVFYEPSPRYVPIALAASIAAAVGPFVSTVGLFVNADADTVRQVLAAVPLQVLQFHGDETADFCDQFQRPYMKAIRMKPDLDVESAIRDYPNAVGILLDAYRKGVPGGTGETFDWARVPLSNNTSLPPIILAGGLTSQNVQAAIQQTRPYGVDVSGGVEQTAGKKDQQKVMNFIKNAKTE
jgi:phosphoribosylanthranilate isomerase